MSESSEGTPGWKVPGPGVVSEPDSGAGIGLARRQAKEITAGTLHEN